MSNVTEVLSKKVYALDQALVLFCLMLQRELIFIKVADLNIYNMYIYICMYIYIYIYITKNLQLATLESPYYALYN